MIGGLWFTPISDLRDVQTPKYQTEAPPKHLNYSTIQLIGYANLFLFMGVGPPRKPDMWETKIAHRNSGLGIFQNYSNLPMDYISLRIQAPP